MPMSRPNPVRWLWYTVGGKLPERYREWVLHDVTVRTWWLRHTLRTLVRQLPVLLALVLVFSVLIPQPAWVVVLAVLLGVVVGVYYSLAYAAEANDSRLVRYGYPMGHATAIRRARGESRRARDDLRYREAWRPAE